MALASPFAPLTLSLKATSTKSIPTLASSAVLAQKLAPAKLSSPEHNCLIRNFTVSDSRIDSAVRYFFAPPPTLPMKLSA